jgi:hypothetical protein
MKRTLAASGVLLLTCAAATTPTWAGQGRGTTTQCYIWNNEATHALGVFYAPSETYSFNAAHKTGGNLVRRNSTGVYTVSCADVGELYRLRHTQSAIRSVPDFGRGRDDGAKPREPRR